MTGRSKLSSKNQIVIPKALREYAGLRSGDEILISGAGGGLLICKRPDNYTEHMLGLGRELWENVDPAEYIKKLRSSWKKRTRK